MGTFCRQTLLVVVVLLTASFVSAQWSSDPAVNLMVGGGPGLQTIPHVAVVTESSSFIDYSYVGFYTTESGNYDMALQLLSPEGNPLFADGGMIVSAYTQDSWVMDWGLAVDAEANALVTFADIRDGNSNIHVYKISPNGDFLWGADGITLTDDANFKGAPTVTATNNGDVVVVWMQESTTTGVRMQRLTSNGDLLLAPGGVMVSEPGDASPFGTELVPTVAGDVILAYVPVYSFMSNRQIKAQRFDATGAPVWASSVWVMDDSTVPMGQAFNMTPDGNDGALFAWSVSVGSAFGARIQHLDADGLELMLHNGATANAAGATGQINPSAVFDPITGETTMVFVQMNGSQSEKGIGAQRFDMAGTRLWGNAGSVVLPQDTVLEGMPGIVLTSEGVLGMCFQAPSNVYGQDLVVAFRLGDAGELVWDTETVVAASTPSAKGDLLVALTGEMALGIWYDDRNGDDDVFAQSANLDGSLGQGAVSSVEIGDDPGQLELPASLLVYDNYPNPFNPSTTIKFDLPRATGVTLRIIDARGRTVCTLIDGHLPAAQHTVDWNGADDNGRRQPSGTYYYSLTTEYQVTTKKMMLVK